jgi:hypothetical protein
MAHAKLMKRRGEEPLTLRVSASARFRVSFLLCLLLGSGWFCHTLAGRDEFPEYKLKAAFLYNFAKFISWPTNAFSATNTPLTIGVLGNDPFGPLLKDTVEGKTVNGRSILLRPLKRDEQPTGCHILFISRSEKERIPSILAGVEGQSILTVSEVDRFAHAGGMINFLVVSENVRFEINMQTAERAGLRVSSKLAGVGIVVKSEAK